MLSCWKPTNDSKERRRSMKPCAPPDCSTDRLGAPSCRLPRRFRRCSVDTMLMISERVRLQHRLVGRV
jgi:hypothetical protein